MAPALKACLAPWLSRFSDCTRQWTHLPTHGNRLGVAFELEVDLTKSLVGDNPKTKLLELREAIDLVLLTLVVEPAALEPLLRQDEWSHFDEDDEDAVQSVIAHGARAELRLKLCYDGIQTQHLVSPFATQFLHELGYRLSPNETFLSLRRELLERLQSDPVPFARFQQVEIPVTMVIDSGKLREIDTVAANAYFVSLTVFSKSVVTHQSQSDPLLWPSEACHAPLRIETIELSMYGFCITHSVAHAAQAFVNAGVPVHLSQLNLDPRLILTVEQGVQDYVSALTRTTNELAIYAGVDPNEYGCSVDGDNQDRRSTVAMILTLSDASTM